MTDFEKLLTMPPVDPPHDWGDRPYFAANGFAWAIDRASGKVYCTPCATTAISGRGITIESVGIRYTVSKKLLGDQPVCQSCGKALIRVQVRRPRTKTSSTTARTLGAMGKVLKAMGKIARG